MNYSHSWSEIKLYEERKLTQESRLRLFNVADFKNLNHKTKNIQKFEKVPSRVMEAPKATTMEYRKLGKSGLEVSVIAYGDMGAQDNEENQKKTNEIVNKCFEVGINYFDTAEGYGNGQHELLLGRALKQCGKKREDYVVSTKIFLGTDKKTPNAQGNARKHLIEGLNASLKRLQLDYVDIVFSHRHDDDVPVEEVVFAFAQIIKEGKAFYWATSEWTPDQIIEAMWVADKYGLPAPVAEQNQYNLLHRQNQEVTLGYLFDKFGYGTTIWSPAAGGLLTNKYAEDVDITGSRFQIPLVAKMRHYNEYFGPEIAKESQKKWKELLQVAKEFGTDNLSVLALAWCIRNKEVSTVIGGLSKIQYVEDAVKALEISKKFTKETEERINKLFPAPNGGLNWKTRQPVADRRLAQY